MTPNYGPGVVATAAPGVDANGYPICDLCERRIDPASPGVLSLVVGWVEARSGGGAHAVTDRHDLGRWRHKACHKYPPEEARLFT